MAPPAAAGAQNGMMVSKDKHPGKRERKRMKKQSQFWSKRQWREWDDDDDVRGDGRPEGFHDGILISKRTEWEWESSSTSLLSLSFTMSTHTANVAA